MCNKKTLLSICIPTYNRAHYLKNLLSFLNAEISAFEEEPNIEIVISDNCSTDNTQECVDYARDSWNTQIPIIYNRNNENIGGDNNFKKLIYLANGEYLWWMGDDDVYQPNIIKQVYEVITTRQYSYVFINHCGISKGKIVKPTALAGVDYSKEDKSVILEMLRYSGMSLMFISASVHRVDVLRERLDAGVKVNMAFSLYMALNSATKGKVKILSEILIDDNFDVDWSDRSTQAFLIDVPYVLRKLPELGYPEEWKDVYKMYLHRMEQPATVKELILKMLTNPRFAAASLLKNHFVFKNLID